MHGTISSELNDIWKARRHASERQQESQSPSKYEKTITFGSNSSNNISNFKEIVGSEENDKKDETAADSTSKKVDSDSKEEEQDTHQKEKGVSNKKKKLIC
ncbi:hypothetical protein LOK49_LG01G03361 [Camellia lanceoleosa]|uniref:Uncharacterized protein n=1 Tax=Camellia lanceoleosa TaxID=1840588 RepID=A0ACC0J1V5_9ERIC|nr:hypothetical protein LOK49_LG01G03361 [Camellia lanceoleosa]